MKTLNKLMAIAIALTMSAGAACALSLDSDTISYDSDNTTGLNATDGWQSPDTSLTWEINEVSPGIWSYHYEWNAPTRGVSHFVLEVTDDADSDEFWGYSAEDANGNPMNFTIYDPQTHLAGSSGNPGMLYDTYGIKFEDPVDNQGNPLDPLYVSLFFFSTHSPTWGDVYFKDGTMQPGNIDVYAYNAGYSSGGAGAGDDSGAHAAVPNGVHVPDSGATLMLLGTAMAALAIFSKRF